MNNNKFLGFKMAGLYWLGSSVLPLKILLTILPLLIYFAFDISEDLGLGILLFFAGLAVFSDVIVGAIYLKVIRQKYGADLYIDLLSRFMNIDETQKHYDFDVDEIINRQKSS